MSKKLLIFFILLFSIPVVSAQQIYDCQNLYEEGIYELQNDITSSGTCFRILEDNIVLDLNGYTVSGSETGVGVHIDGHSFNEVRNGKISNFNIGLFLEEADYNIIEDVVIRANEQRGVEIEYSNNNRILKNEITNNNKGIYQIFSEDNLILKNDISRNYDGIEIRYSEGNKILKNSIYLNYEGGVGVMNGARNNEIMGNEILNNNVGVYFGLSEDNLIFNNYLNNEDNVDLNDGINFWSISVRNRRNIIGDSYMGGNYWANPDGSGFSETCEDLNRDGICDNSYTLNEDNIDYFPLTERQATVSTSD